MGERVVFGRWHRVGEKGKDIKQSGALCRCDGVVGFPHPNPYIESKSAKGLWGFVLAGKPMESAPLRQNAIDVYEHEYPNVCLYTAKCLCTWIYMYSRLYMYVHKRVYMAEYIKNGIRTYILFYMVDGYTICTYPQTA